MAPRSGLINIGNWGYFTPVSGVLTLLTTGFLGPTLW